MKKIIILALLCTAALAAPDSLECRMIDWLDVEGTTLLYGSTGDGGYEYSGTWLWDMAMGDSFLVWLPGTDIYYIVNPLSQTEVETLFSRDYGSVAAKGCNILDSIYFTVGGGVNSLKYVDGSIEGVGHLHVDWASFHYATIRDTFLYTISTGSYGLHCINIADPGSIFVAWTREYFGGSSGLEVVDSVVYTASASTFEVSPPDDWHWRPNWYLLMGDISGDTCVYHSRINYFDNEHHCSIASNENNLFYVYSEMSDFLSGVQDYTLGDSHLGIWGTDYSYTWSDYDSEGIFGVDVLNDTIIAVGFEHGFSIIDYSQLGGMTEVAYYRDTDSVFAFTHFALKEDRLFAMAHPRDDTCRMYMFEIADSVVTGQGEASIPEQFHFWNYPNPFNSECKLVINADSDYRNSRLEIFDINGRQVYSEKIALKTGFNTFIWHPQNTPSGLYLARIVIGEQSYTSKLVYLA